MMEANSLEGKSPRPSLEELRTEAVAAARYRYEAMFHRRWGRRPPRSGAARILVVHDENYEGKPLAAIRARLEGEMRIVESRRLGGEARPFPHPGEFEAVVIATVQSPGEDREELRKFIDEVRTWSGLVAGIGGGSSFLAEAGLIRPGPDGGIETPDGVLACASREESESLLGELLERIEAARSERTEEDRGTRDEH